MNIHSPELIARAQRVADRLLALIDDAHAAVVVASEDGFDVAHASGPRAQIEPGRLAAMASSLAAIGEVVGRETGLGVTECLVTETAEGYAVMRTASYDGRRVVLTALASRRTVLGLLMHAVAGSAREFSA